MLSQICLYLKNWFDDNQPKFFGEFSIADGQLNIAGDIQSGQYYRIVGSVFNDGVYKRGKETLIPETFKGAVWLMAVPPDVIGLAAEIEGWQAKYGSLDNENMSPFQSESFGGYSYSKGSSGGSTGHIGGSWIGTFGDRLRRYKKI